MSEFSKPQDWLEKHVGLENFKGGFERAYRLLRPLAQKISDKSKVVTIAGTNGKGQVACDLSFLLEQKGYKVARWTSPHIIDPVERFYFSDRALSSSSLLSSFESAKDILKHSPSYYEFLFYVFCCEVLKREVDVVILEVGLGGRLDAVNVFDADLCAITSISLDHQDILGSDLVGILREKWGVTRSKRSVLTCLHQKKLRDKARQWASEQDLNWFDLFEQAEVDLSLSYVKRNQKLAIALAFFLDQNIETWPKEILSKINHNFPVTKGRFEEMTRGALRFIFIGAHNSDGLQNMVESLNSKEWSSLCFDEVWFSFSKRRADELDDFFHTLSRLNQKTRHWRYCEFEHPKALKKNQDNDVKNKWSSWFKRLGPTIQSQQLGQAVDELAESSTILVTGSYYFIGEVQKKLLSLS